MALFVGLFIVGLLFLIQAIVSFARRQPRQALVPLLASVMAFGFLLYLLHDWGAAKEYERKAATQPVKKE